MGYVSWQINVLDHMRPGSWLPGFFKNRHRAQRSYTCAPGTFSNNVVTAMADVGAMLEENKTTHMYVARVNAAKRRVYVHFLTPAKWLDVLTIHFCTQAQADEQGFVSFDLVSRSTCIIPASVPGAPILGAIFCWVPFRDHLQNSKHIQAVVKIMNSKKVIPDDQVPLTAHSTTNKYLASVE
jgi:hypothetical protein